MKTTLFKSLVLAALSFAAASLNAQAQNVEINAMTFPDQNFRNWVLAQSYGADGVLTPDEISAVTEINVENKGIYSLEGIKYFTNLRSLDCSDNQLDNLDVSQNTLLTRLYCRSNQLQSLDVSQNTWLITFYCDGNQLDTLDVSQNTALRQFWCHRNQLASIDVSLNLALENFYCDDNQLTELDVTKNTALEYLHCGNNQLSTLDVTKNTALKTLDCQNTLLTSINVSQNLALETLECNGNQLTGLDVTKNTALKYLRCQKTSLTSLDVTMNPELRNFYCANNQLTSLDVTKNTKLSHFDCGSNQLDALDVTNCPELTGLFCERNKISILDVTKCTKLEWFFCQRNQITGLDVTNCPELVSLQIHSNPINTLDVTNCTKLDILHCGANQLSTLDVSKCTVLRVLYCAYNFLRDLDLSNNPALEDYVNTAISPQYPFDEVAVGGTNRDKLAVPMPQIEAARMADLKSYGADIPLEYVTIGGVNHLVIASSGNADIHCTDESSSRVTYTVTPKYHPDVPSGISSKKMNVTLRHLPFHALYLNPASINNNRDGVYTGTLYLDVPTIIPTDCDLKAYAAEGITRGTEEAGRLELSQAQTGILPTGSGVVVTATQPGYHLFTGDAVLNVSGITHSSDNITYNTTPAAYTGNILAGTYDASGLPVPYGSVLTLGPRRDDGSGTVGFWNYAGTLIPQFRCYIPTSEIPSMQSGGGTRFMGLSLLFPDEEGTVTGIDAAPAGSPASVSAAAVYYDLQGRRVAEPRKGGIYIIGGRKVAY